MMMGRFRGILAAGDRTILDRVEGRITCQSWDAMPWSGYVVVPRVQLAKGESTPDTTKNP
jgi:hypothetical protein